jgi:hypothetical protein
MRPSRSALTIALVLLTMAITPASLWCQASGNLGDVRTTTGKVFVNAKVLFVDPDGLRLQHDAGVSKVPFTDLPASIRNLFPHDPAKAAEFAARVEADNRKAILSAEHERAQADYNERCLKAGLPPGFVIPNKGPLSISHVKARWLLDNIANYPTFGDRDREIREAQIEFRKMEILSGARDREAEEISLRHNLDWYLHHGQTAEAELARKRLADMQAEVTKLAEVAAMEKIAESLSRLASEAAYRSDINSELHRIRCELERTRTVPIFVPHGQGHHGHMHHNH